MSEAVDTEAPPPTDGTPPSGTTPSPDPGTPPRPPRRLRSFLIGVVLAGILAVLLFVVLRPSANTGGNSTAGVTVGDTAPNFTLPRLGGGAPVNLYAIGVDRHKPVVLNFFASWCGPCQQETPMLAKEAKEAAADGSPVKFVGVDVNDLPSAALAFVKQTGITYPVGADRTLHVTSTVYGLNGQPNTFFINASGQVVEHKLGALTASELKQWVKQLANS